MTLLFRSDQLHITDDWIRSAVGTFAIRDVRNAWVTRRQIGRGSRLVTGLLGVAALLIVIGGAGASGWRAHNWLELPATPVPLFVAAGVRRAAPLPPLRPQTPPHPSIRTPS